MKKLIYLWDKFWFSRFDPVSVSIFRIFLGALIFIMFLSNFSSWERFYASDGIISLKDIDIVRPGEDIWSIFYLTEGKIPVIFYWWVGLISSLAFTIGWQTRIATIILFVLQFSMIHRDLYIVNGEDLVFRVLLFYSCFAPLNHCLSIDSFLKRKKFGDSELLPMIWSVRLIQITVALVYVISLPNKLADDFAWINGDAIYLTVVSNLWSRCPFPELFYKWNGLLSKIATYGTIFVESTFPIFVWFKQTRLIVLALITSLHLGIALLVPNVMFFTLAMVCAFWVFVPAEVIRKPKEVFSMKLNFKNIFLKAQNMFGIDVRSLAVLRIAISIIIIADLILRFQDLTAFYTDEGIFPRIVFLEMYGDWQSSLYLINGSRSFTVLLFILTIVSALFLLVGYKTWLANFISWLLVSSLHARNPLVLTGGDTLLHLILFWCMFLPLGAFFSLDNLFGKTPRKILNPVLSIGSIGLLLQVSLVYFFTALQKISPEWITDGSAIYYALNQDQYVTHFGKFLLNYPELLKVMTCSVFWFEAIGPILFFSFFFTSQIRLILILGFLFLQLGFGLSLTVGIFPYITTAAILVFLPSLFWEKFRFSLNVEPLSSISFSLKSVFLNLLAAYFLLNVVLWNFQSLEKLNFQMPIWLSKTSFFFHLEQGWIMFGPKSLKEDFWYVFPGTLTNDRKVDIFTNGGEINWQKPKMASSMYKNHRWRTYLRNLWVSDKRLYPYYGQYLCDKWNRSHDKDSLLKEIEFYYAREDTLPNYLPSKPSFGLVYRHSCY